jgi:hypothetical protein
MPRPHSTCPPHVLQHGHAAVHRTQHAGCAGGCNPGALAGLTLLNLSSCHVGQHHQNVTKPVPVQPVPCPSCQVHSFIALTVIHSVKLGLPSFLVHALLWHLLTQRPLSRQQMLPHITTDQKRGSTVAAVTVAVLNADEPATSPCN